MKMPTIWLCWKPACLGGVVADISVPLDNARRLNECITRAQDAGEMDRARATAMKNELLNLTERYSTVMTPAQASARAAEDLRAAASRRAPARFNAVISQLSAMRRIRDAVENSSTPDLVIRNLLEHSETSGARVESLQSIRRAYIRSINGALSQALRRVGLNAIGNSKDAPLLERIIRELHNESTGDKIAKELADTVRSQQERLRQVFNAHGGDIGKLDDFGVSHMHNVARLREVGFPAWRDAIKERLDWSRIVNRDTDKPFAKSPNELPADAVIDRFLNDVYNNITSRGWNTRQPSLQPGGKALYNRRADHRVLHFRDGQTWLDYNREFGVADPFSALMGGLHGMGRDIAMMRTLGPNPRLGIQYAEQVATKRAETAGNSALVDRIARNAKLARTMLSHVDGSANQPFNTAWASFFSGVRSTLTSIQLGSAILSAPTDIATMRVAARTSGLNPNNVTGRHVQLMANSATRETAAQMGYVADTLAEAGGNAARYVGEMWTPELANRLAGFTMRASGLSYWTDMGRIAFQMEFAGALAAQASKPLRELPPPLRRALQNRGIGEADWNRLRGEAIFQADNGAQFLSPFYWLEHQTALPRIEAEGLAMRLQGIVEEQMEMAVPTVRLEGQARTMGLGEPGSVPGEVVRSLGMYKSFAVSLMIGQYRRFMAVPSPLGRAAYAARLQVGLLVLASLSVQLKEMAKGRDPRPMDDVSFWMAAMFQAGGLGIFGDFFAAETSRTGGGLAETIAGPVAGLAGDAIGLVAENVNAAVQGDPLRLGRDVTSFARYNTPVLSSLWQVRAGYDRIVMDNLQRFLDPEAERQWRQQERRRQRDFGNESWWRRGQLLPERGPNLANAAGSFAQ